MLLFKKIVLLALLLSCTKKPETASSKSDLNILFIGNSLTYANDLPSIVAGLAAQDGIKATCNAVAVGNYSLEDHWNDGIENEIKKDTYDYIVVQQGPSAAPESQVHLLTWVTKMKETCNRTKKKLVVFMVWPANYRIFDLDNVILSYTNAATKTNSILAPAGLAWKLAWEKQSNFPLYSSDEFHPSFAGSFLSALSIYGAIKEKKNFDFVNLEKAGWDKEVTLDQFITIKTAAIKALIH